MEKQEDVKTDTPEIEGVANSSLAEQETITDAAPVAEEQDETTETPVIESNDEQIEAKPQVSKEVPYDRFKEVYDELKMYKEAAIPPGTPTEEDIASQLDDKSATAVRQIAQQIATQQIERQKSLDFVRKHGADLKDPLLAAAYRNETDMMMARGEYVDYEGALNSAKAILDKRLGSTTTQAKNEGIEEGKESVKKKLEAGSVGDSVKTEEIPTDKLSAEDFAKKMGLKKI